MSCSKTGSRPCSINISTLRSRLINTQSTLSKCWLRRWLVSLRLNCLQSREMAERRHLFSGGNRSQQYEHVWSIALLTMSAFLQKSLNFTRSKERKAMGCVFSPMRRPQELICFERPFQALHWRPGSKNKSFYSVSWVLQAAISLITNHDHNL